MKKYTYSKELANIVKNVLDDSGLRYSFNEETGLFDFGMRLRGKIQNIRYAIDIKDDEILVYGISPLGPNSDNPEMMARMAEFICRANYGLRNGNFEFDFRDGEIRYKSFIDCDNVIPSSDVITNSIGCVGAMFDHYSSGITDIIFREADAKDAMAKSESETEDAMRGLLEALTEDTDEKDLLAMIEELAEKLGIPADELNADESDPEDTGDDHTESVSQEVETLILDPFKKNTEEAS